MNRPATGRAKPLRVRRTRANGWLLAGIGVALAGTLAAGFALVRADERSSAAHAAPPPVEATSPAATETPLPDAIFDKPASAIGAPPPPQAAQAAQAPATRAPATQAPAQPAPADQGFVIRRILPVKGAIRYGDWHWDEANVPAGPIVITVDLEARVISIFRAGYEIGTAAVLLGTQEKPTPTGMFPITQKDAHHVSNLYDAPMPYMMRLTNDGITIHATNVRNGYASHGCIGVPLAFAKRVFDTAHVGDRVYITRGKQVGLGAKIAP
ncbi:MAG TPA: L,D-transpeptidase family protein [Novosphingobium sp.]|nr:L,D-transpeptidase family protein [Novosphingobium sp.]